MNDYQRGKSVTDIEFQRSVRRLAIVAMFSDDYLMEQLVLKGGNLLDHAYQISSRSSVDIDFSIAAAFDDPGDVLRRVKICLSIIFQESALFPFDVRLTPRPPNDVLSDDLRDIWGGYFIRFKLIEEHKRHALHDQLDQLRRNAIPLSGSKADLEIDVSRHEYCESKRTFMLDDVTIFGYSPESFICEKIRAICQQMPAYDTIVRRRRSDDNRGRARDFFDIYEVMRHLGPERQIDLAANPIHELIKHIFLAKRVPLGMIGEIAHYRNAHADDFQSVRDTVKPGYDLRDFDFYFDFVVEQCRLLEPLWHE